MILKIRFPIHLVWYVVLLLSACQDTSKVSKFSGYSLSPNGLYYHRYTIGDGKDYALNGDYLELRLKLMTLTNEELPFNLFKNEAGFDTLHFLSSELNYHFYEALSMLCEGDSCSFIMRTELFCDTEKYSGMSAFFKKDTLVRMEAKLIRLKTQKQQEAEQKNYLNFCRELAADEQKELLQFLDTTKQNFPKKPDQEGLYMVMLKKGNGKRAKPGDNVTIRYVGKFLDGQIFDNTTMTKEPLNFTLGEPGQVVKGLELALYKMNEGDVVLILLPSSLAFGNKGSAGGIVSPFKSVTFALEILKINK